MKLIAIPENAQKLPNNRLRTFRDSTLRTVQHYNITTLLTNGSNGHKLARITTVLLRSLRLYYAIPQHLELQIAKLRLQL